MNKLTISLIILLFALVAHASDVAKEKRWANQVIEALIDGDATWLKTDDAVQQEFLGIYTEADAESHNAAIVIHGIGVHPDWPQVVQPLRVGLASRGWNTLSIQMPILANEAKYEDYAPLFEEVSPRIRAAIKYLKDADNTRIVIISHSLGSAMAAYHLAKSSDDIAGFAGIGMSADSFDERMDQSHSLLSIKIPVLDLYGEEDLDAVLKTKDKRAQAAKKSANENYTQIEISAANHFFDDKENILTDTVEKWLQELK